MTTVKGKMGIVGARGFIGGELAEQASRLGWQVVGFSRSEQLADEVVREWRRWSDEPDLSGLRVVVNLAGESIAQRWTKRRREKFHASRVGVTTTIVKAQQQQDAPLEVLINGSAVGIYGDGGNRRLSEDAPHGEGYLADLCEQWEAAALLLEKQGVRVVRLRTGIVLGHGGDAWEQLSRLFRLGLGGKLGSGRQWMPWIHVEDEVAVILHAIDEKLEGPINGVSPEPERNMHFTRKLAKSLRRPAVCHAPEWALKAALGGFGGMLLASQRAVPTRLLASGYRFRFPNLEMALDDLVH